MISNTGNFRFPNIPGHPNQNGTTSTNMTNSNFRSQNFQSNLVPQSRIPIHTPVIIPSSPIVQPIQIQIRYVPRPRGLDVDHIEGKEELMNYIDKFADRDHYICSICTNILWEPTACGKCSQIFCLGCLAQWLEAKPSCPNCREQMEIKKCDPSIAANLARLKFHCQNKAKSGIFPTSPEKTSNNIINTGNTNLPICSNEGCNDIIIYDSLIKHNDTCEYEQIFCVNTGCKFSSFRKDFSMHELTCPYKDVDCKWCCRKVKQFMKIDHENECEMRVVECVNEGCEVRLPFVHLDNHLQQCPYTRVNCSYCRESQIISEIEMHEAYCDERVQQCSGCTNPFRLVELRNHQLICQQVQIQCSECSCVLSRGELLENHSEIQCLQYGMKILFQSKLQQENKVNSLQNENLFLRKEVQSLKFQITKIYENQNIIKNVEKRNESQLTSSRYELIPNFNQNPN